MGAFIARRLVQVPIVLLLIVTAIFFLVRLSGDPAALLLPADASVEDIAEFRVRLGLERPLYAQYVIFLRSALVGDFGDSLFFNRDSLALVLERLRASLELAVVSLMLAIVLGVTSGVLSATRRGSTLDEVGMTVSLLGQSMPTFWLGLILILVFSVQLGWLPPSGRGGVTHLVLPAVSLGAYSAARIARLVRSSMLDVMSREFIRTARAKGLAEVRVIWKHALRNAAIPTVTIIGLQLGALFGGAVVTETVFAWPGIGRLLMQAVLARDFPLVSACTFVVAVVFVFSNIIVDLTYGLLNPRIRYE